MVDRQRNRQGGGEAGPPTRIAEGTPTYVGSDYSFTLQAVMEMQKTLGQLVQGVASLQEAQKETKTQVEAIAQKVHTAQTVAWVVGIGVMAIVSFVGWMITSAIQVLPTLLNTKR